jgi:hypothetical protein
VRSLLPNGVFVAVIVHYLTPGAPTSHNRVLDGHLATVEPVSAAAGGCPGGATGAMQLSIFVPQPDSEPGGSGTTVTMEACYAGPDTASILRDIDALADSVHFT